MRLIDDMVYDFDFTMPRIIATGRLVIFENMSEIVMISENVLTVSSGGRSKKYTTVSGEGFVIKEIGEGRLVIEGKIRSVEFL